VKEIKYTTHLFFILILMVSVAQANTYPSNGVLKWKGQNWYLTGGKANPGNNYWNNSGAWVDNQNRLHLTVIKENETWKCTMLSSQYTYLYGTFTWTIASSVYLFDRNSIVGLCTYLDDFHELDIEVSKWGEASGNQLWYSIQPSNINGNSKGYFVPCSITGTNTVYKIDWKPRYVGFTSSQTNGKIIADYKYTNVSGIPQLPQSVIMNLWLMAPPSNGKNLELIISNFTATNYKTTNEHIM
jgi:endo-1,3-1,4-beta-glycanase ExoK